MSPESDCWLGAFSESTDLEGGVLLIAEGSPPAYCAISMVSPGAMAPPSMTLQNTPSRGMMQSPTWW